MKAPVKGVVLSWARDKVRRMTLEEAAKATGLSLEDLRDFEHGDAKPTLGQLEKIAKGYMLPLGTLLMPEPLPDDYRPQVKDFRVHKGRAPKDSLELMTAIDMLHEQATALVDILDAVPELIPEAALPEIERRMPPEAAANLARRRFNVSVEQQMKFGTPTQAFKKWRSRIEQQGVFVYSLDMGEWRDCRGYSWIDDPRVPLIAINKNDDNEGARLFTLVHEFCHLLLRQGGISDQNRNDATERYCNQFAGYFLMPRAEFAAAARTLALQRGNNWSDAMLKALGSSFGTSMSAVALHLEDLGFVLPGFYDRKRAEWDGRQKKKPFGKSTYTEKQIGRYGENALNTMFAAVDRGALNNLDVFDLTNVKPEHYGKLRKDLIAHHKAFGGG